MMKAAAVPGQFPIAPSILALLFLLFIWLLPGFSGRADGMPAGGPDLQISSVYGNLEQGRPESISVVLSNNGLQSMHNDEPRLSKESARSISAELISTDSRIKVLSGIQLAGLLEAGDNVTLKFTAQAEGDTLGIYPFQLRLNYSQLYQVAASGDEGSAASLVFSYRDASIELPLQVEVIQGPGVLLEEARGQAVPGKESKLELILANRGDERARDVFLQACPSPPFLMVENSNKLNSLDPEESVSLAIAAFTDENATPGYYALPCRITYRNGQDGENRSFESAAFVYVASVSYSSWLYPGAAGLALLLMLIAAALFIRKKLREFMRGRRRVRIIS
jgi:hypothetical protein